MKKKNQLTPFIRNIFLYCFPNAFFGSVKTYKCQYSSRLESDRGNP